MSTRTFDEQIQLIGLVENTNENGFPVIVEQPQPPIFANKLSIHSSEFWHAKNSGVKLSITFEVHSFEFNGEEKLLFEEKEYDIERTYEKGDLVELVCKRKNDNHAT